MSEGLVLWGVKNIYYVLDNKTNKEYKCLIKGKTIETGFDIKGRTETNPIVVGDIVEFDKIDEYNGLITNRKQRKNEYKRLKKSGRVVQTLFANINLLIVVDSISSPPIRPYFIDRALFTADYMDIPAMIVFNKIDLLNKENKDIYKKVKPVYKKLGYNIIETSVKTKLGIQDLKNVLKDKTSCFNGRSGVGKSSLVKELDPAYSDIKIGEINTKYDRGKHVTSYAKIYHLEFNANIIDTPGIRELAVYVDKPEDVERNIRDFEPYREGCKFINCQHINEPDCKVLDALENEKIEEFRYESYLRIRSTIQKLDDSKI